MGNSTAHPSDEDRPRGVQEAQEGGYPLGAFAAVPPAPLEAPSKPSSLKLSAASEVSPQGPAPEAPVLPLFQPGSVVRAQTGQPLLVIAADEYVAYCWPFYADGKWLAQSDMTAWPADRHPVSPGPLFATECGRSAGRWVLLPLSMR